MVTTSVTMEKLIDTKVTNRFMKLKIVFLVFLLICLQCQPSNNQASHDDSATEEQNFINSIVLDEKEFMGKIYTNENEWFIMAGKSCKDCDENISLYLLPKKGFAGSDSIEHSRYSFPGKLLSFDDQIVFESRAFYGECISGLSNVIVWVQKQQTGDGQWKESMYVIELYDQSIKETEINENLLTIILNKVKESKCFEIPERDQTTEP